MDMKTLEVVTLKIREMANNSLNFSFDIYSLKEKLSEVEVEDLNDVLLYLEQKKLIKVTNKASYHEPILKNV